MDAHIGDMIWCDGNIITPPTKYQADENTTIYYLTIACHNDDTGQTVYVDAKAVKKTAQWVEKQEWVKGQDVIIKGQVTSPETIGLDGRQENMKIRILNIATHTSRQGA